jgi:hypothetical protein
MSDIEQGNDKMSGMLLFSLLTIGREQRRVEIERRVAVP